MFENKNYLDRYELEKLVNQKLIGSYLWMGLGLLISFGIMFYSQYNEAILRISFNLASSRMSFLILLAVVFGLGAVIRYGNSLLLKGVFIAYSIFIGFLLVPYILVYELNSIYSIVLGTSILFVIMSLYGYMTKDNLQGYTKYLFFALLSVIIVSLLNVFLFKSNSLDMVISLVGCIVFVIYTAIDTQRIKGQIIQAYYYEDMEIINKIQIMGALHLYLDFINMFIYLISLFGRRRD